MAIKIVGRREIGGERTIKTIENGQQLKGNIYNDYDI